MIGSPSDVMHVLDLIQTHKMKSGLAISPNTPASSITDEMGNKADLLLVMTVHPGRGGQKFMPECLKKVEELRSRFPGKNIQVDGGVSGSNACQCAQAGTIVPILNIDLG
jgi:ribulose-phosphate 3-epimerase